MGNHSHWPCRPSAPTREARARDGRGCKQRAPWRCRPHGWRWGRVLELDELAKHQKWWSPKNIVKMKPRQPWNNDESPGPDFCPALGWNSRARADLALPAFGKKVPNKLNLRYKKNIYELNSSRAIVLYRLKYCVFFSFSLSACYYLCRLLKLTCLL